MGFLRSKAEARINKLRPFAAVLFNSDMASYEDTCPKNTYHKILNFATLCGVAELCEYFTAFTQRSVTTAMRQCIFSSILKEKLKVS